MRLIDADALEVFVKTVRQGLYLDKTLSDIPTRDSMLLNFQQYVHLQPTIDAVPVVRGECNHCKEDSCELCFNAGHYVICEDGMNETCEYFQKMKFCPNCGAKMEDKA